MKIFPPKTRLFARFSYDQAQSYVPGGAPGLRRTRRVRQQPEHRQSCPQRGHFRDSHFFARPPSIRSASVSTGFSTTSPRRATAVATPTSSASPTPIWEAISCGLTSVELSSPYWSLGDRGYTPFVGGTNVWTFSDSFDMVRGKHDIRIGGSIRANQLNTVAVGFPNGFWVVIRGGHRRSRGGPADRAGRPSVSTTRSSAAAIPAAAGNSTAPSSRTIGESARI